MWDTIKFLDYSKRDIVVEFTQKKSMNQMTQEELDKYMKHFIVDELLRGNLYNKLNI